MANLIFKGLDNFVKENKVKIEYEDNQKKDFYINQLFSGSSTPFDFIGKLFYQKGDENYTNVLEFVDKCRDCDTIILIFPAKIIANIYKSVQKDKSTNFKDFQQTLFHDIKSKFNHEIGNSKDIIVLSSLDRNEGNELSNIFDIKKIYKEADKLEEIIIAGLEFKVNGNKNYKVKLSTKKILIPENGGIIFGTKNANILKIKFNDLKGNILLKINNGDEIKIKKEIKSDKIEPEFGFDMDKKIYNDIYGESAESMLSIQEQISKLKINNNLIEIQKISQYEELIDDVNNQQEEEDEVAYENKEIARQNFEILLKEINVPTDNLIKLNLTLLTSKEGFLLLGGTPTSQIENALLSINIDTVSNNINLKNLTDREIKFLKQGNFLKFIPTLQQNVINEEFLSDTDNPLELPSDVDPTSDTDLYIQEKEGEEIKIPVKETTIINDVNFIDFIDSSLEINKDKIKIQYPNGVSVKTIKENIPTSFGRYDIQLAGHNMDVSSDSRIYTDKQKALSQLISRDQMEIKISSDQVCFKNLSKNLALLFDFPNEKETIKRNSDTEKCFYLDKLVKNGKIYVGENKYLLFKIQPSYK